MHGVVTMAVAALFVLPTSVPPTGTQAEITETTKAQVIDAIEKYVEQDAQVKEAFLVLDPRNGEPLRLAFDHVHAGVETHDKGYAACIDFKDRAGKVYDVDIVVGKTAERMEVVKVFLHKVEGKAVTAK